MGSIIQPPRTPHDQARLNRWVEAMMELYNSQGPHPLASVKTDFYVCGHEFSFIEWLNLIKQHNIVRVYADFRSTYSASATRRVQVKNYIIIDDIDTEI